MHKTLSFITIYILVKESSPSGEERLGKVGCWLKLSCYLSLSLCISRHTVAGCQEGLRGLIAVGEVHQHCFMSELGRGRQYNAAATKNTHP